VTPYDGSDDTEPKESATRPAKADGAGEVPEYRLFSADVTSVGISDIHLVAAHFCLSPAVPSFYKCVYFMFSAGCVVLQITAMVALVASVEGMAASDINDSLTELHSWDWAMVLLCSCLVAFSVHSDLMGTRTLELHLRATLDTSDPRSPGAPSWSTLAWVMMLTLTQKFRCGMLLPLVLTTVPVLAYENDMTAYSLALNCLAILFIFDVDDQAVDFLLNHKQKAYLEQVEVRLTSDEALSTTVLNWFAVVVTILIFFVPVAGGNDFFKEFHLVVPWPAIPCLLLAGICVFFQSLVYLGVDAAHACRHARQRLPWLVVDLLSTLLVNGLGFLMMTMVTPIGKMWDSSWDCESEVGVCSPGGASVLAEAGSGSGSVGNASMPAAP